LQFGEPALPGPWEDICTARLNGQQTKARYTISGLWRALPARQARDARAGYPQIHYVSNEHTVPGKRYISGETFHTDHSNHPTPPKATMLFPVSLPSHGGDTQYVNMHETSATRKGPDICRPLKLAEFTALVSRRIRA
jgi:alpha-ketoglutarate-dependent taurine dioxygenase